MTRDLQEAAKRLASASNNELILLAQRDPDMIRDVAKAHIWPPCLLCLNTDPECELCGGAVEGRVTDLFSRPAQEIVNEAINTMTRGSRFSHGGREWFAYSIVNEANTRVLLRVRPVMKGQPFPTREEHRAARDFYERITAESPLGEQP